VIQVSDQRDDQDGDFNNGEQYTAPGDESQTLEDTEVQGHNQGNDLLNLCASLINFIYANYRKNKQRI
jgi:hypothetical protein